MGLYLLDLPDDIIHLSFGYLTNSAYKLNKFNELIPGFNSLDNITRKQAKYLLKNSIATRREVWVKIKHRIFQFFTSEQIINYLSTNKSLELPDVIMSIPNWADNIYKIDDTFINLKNNLYATHLMNELEKNNLSVYKDKNNMIIIRGFISIPPARLKMSELFDSIIQISKTSETFEDLKTFVNYNYILCESSYIFQDIKYQTY